MQLPASIDRDHLWRIVGACTAVAECRAPGLETRFDEGAWAVTTGANAWSVNWIVAHGAGGNGLRLLRDALDCAEESGRTTSVVVGEPLLDEAHRLFEGRPMQLDGNPPMMWRDASPVLPNPRPYGGALRQVVAGEDVVPPLDLIARSFDVGPGAQVAAMIGVLDNPAMRMYTATSDALDSVCVTFAAGAVTYIYLLASDPARQRRGAGRAVLTLAMDKAMADGAEGFFLMASSAGQPLYRALGFETYELPEFWEMHPQDHP